MERFVRTEYTATDLLIDLTKLAIAREQLVRRPPYERYVDQLYLEAVSRLVDRWAGVA